jgi:putative transposase
MVRQDAYQRKHVYEEAKKKHPERWSGETRNWVHEPIVKLNPSNEQSPEVVEKKAA